MKKWLLFIGLFVLVVLTSCKKEYINTNTNNNQSFLISLPSYAWTTSDGGVTYSASLNVPEITDYFNQSGEVLIYLSYGNDVYEQIPEVYNNVSYSFTHTTGNVTIYAQDLSQHGMQAPYDATVKVVLVSSGY